MSIYTELLRLGMADDAARQVAEVAHEGTVTKQYLDQRLAQLESRLTRTILTTMIAMTGIFAVFVGAMAWVAR